MLLTLLFADDEIAEVVTSAEGTTIRLSAAFVQKPPASAGEKSLDGFARKVSLFLKDAKPGGATGDLIGRISSGRVRIREEWTSSIPLPSHFTGPVTLDFALSNHSTLLLEASSLECRFDAEENFAESLFC